MIGEDDEIMGSHLDFTVGPDEDNIVAEIDSHRWWYLSAQGFCLSSKFLYIRHPYIHATFQIIRLVLTIIEIIDNYYDNYWQTDTYS